jgi:hypothetical protein
VVKVYFWTWDLGILTIPTTSPVPIPIPIPTPIPASSTLAHACSRHRRVSGPGPETRAVRGGLDGIALHCIIALHRAAGMYRLVSSRLVSRRVGSHHGSYAARLDTTRLSRGRGRALAPALLQRSRQTRRLKNGNDNDDDEEEEVDAWGLCVYSFHYRARLPDPT